MRALIPYWATISDETLLEFLVDRKRPGDFLDRSNGYWKVAFGLCALRIAHAHPACIQPR